MATLVNNVRCGSQGRDFACDTQLRALYDAYLKLISGQNTVQIQSSDFRKVEYGQGNIEELKAHYNGLWDQCGQDSGLPRLGAARGRPAVLGC